MTNNALNLDHLNIVNVYEEILRQINRYPKKKNIESQVASPPQL